MIQKLIQQFGTPRDISGDGVDDETQREEILASLKSVTHYAVFENFVLIRTVKGRCLLEKRNVEGAPMVGFMYKEHNKKESVAFWYNASSVKDLGEALRTVPGKRVEMERMLTE